ncbi:unnamed protein product [Lupinus luteus]|uniref:methionyl-tRNA formyltransferase n=1 Tax=Lupinus luteus TaxID=3873 RepID=A0AAV1W1L3_LUPLU
MNDTPVAVVKEMGEHTGEERRRRRKVEQRRQMGRSDLRKAEQMYRPGPGPSIGSELSSAPTKQVIRRQVRIKSNVTSSSSITNTKKKSVVVLGAPKVSAIVLEALLKAQSQSNSLFEVSGIVTQPPSKRDRGKVLMPTPLAQFAIQNGFDSDLIFTPQRAGDDDFLSQFKALQPDLCVTAAYGNILPNKFLQLPPLGTVNIHPSLLPMYRGAAPVQRALQDGVKETGVSLAFTVRALDAGPVIATESVQVDDQIKAPDLLDLLFYKGSELLIGELPSIFDGSARVKACPQDDSKATLAPKISQEESWLLFYQEAPVLHNKGGQELEQKFW